MGLVNIKTSLRRCWTAQRISTCGAWNAFVISLWLSPRVLVGWVGDLDVCALQIQISVVYGIDSCGVLWWACVVGGRCV